LLEILHEACTSAHSTRDNPRNLADTRHRFSMSASRLMWENEIRAPQFFAGLPQTKPRLRQLSPLPGGHALLRAPQNCLGAKKSEKIRFGFLSTWTVSGSLVVAVLPPAFRPERHRNSDSAILLEIWTR